MYEMLVISIPALLTEPTNQIQIREEARGLGTSGIKTVSQRVSFKQKPESYEFRTLYSLFVEREELEKS